MFNNNTTENHLLYDPFIGLYLTKFEMLFNRHPELTQRPNVGGQFLHTFYNQGASLKRNIEASIEDLRYMYDTFQTFESNLITSNSRKTLGYEGETKHMNLINASAKSQFVFWRGMIQNKGSINSIKAFVNSRRFVDANVDEFWAFKIAEFGSADEKEFISIWISTRDAVSNELRWNFIEPDDVCSAGYADNTFSFDCGFSFPQSGLRTAEFFTSIHFTDTNRWYDQPLQLSKLRDNGGTLFFELKPVKTLNVINNTFITPDTESFMVTVNNITTFNVKDDITGFYEFSGDWDVTSSDPFYMRHNLDVDYVTISLNWYPEGHRWSSNIATNATNTITVDQYIPFANSITVFKDGVKLQSGIDYVEIIVDNQLYSDQITFKTNIDNSLIDVVYHTSHLKVNHHFFNVNANIIEIPDVKLFNGSDDAPSGFIVNNIEIVGWMIDKKAHNVPKIIDVKSDTVVALIPIWDPARGIHQYQANNVIDIKSDFDPAKYSNTQQTNQTTLTSVSSDITVVNYSQWNDQEVGTTWLDTSMMDYVPYYDNKLYPNINDRSRTWGELADWASVKLYTWVRSDVPPSEWDELAIEEEGDISINESVRKSGRAKRTIFEQDFSENWVVYKPKKDHANLLIEGKDVYLRDITSITSTINVAGDDNGDHFNQITISGYHVNKLNKTGNGNAVVSISGTDYEIVSVEVAENGTDTTLTFNQTFDSSFIGAQVIFYSYVNIYVNGRIFKKYINPLPTGLVELDVVDENNQIQDYDYITIISEFDDNEMVDEIDNNNFVVDYEYTEDVEYNNLGIEQTYYYFWVEDVSTNVKDYDITPKEAQIKLVDQSELYIFFDNVKPASVIDFGDQSYMVPNRFTRHVVKGVRGLINENNRYIIRYPRDFSIRDSLDGDSLTRKNLHEEWMLVRSGQLSHIPRDLWDKVTESIIGHLISNSAVLVPSIERVLYDAEFGTDTQYGLGEGQTFVNGALALETVLYHLNNMNTNEVDISVFLQRYKFDTSDDIIEAMDALYNTFSSTNVNKIFFDVLLDAFSTKKKYRDVFKTSMVALHGVRPFQIQGYFDD